jgi:hypothetical protein
MSQQDNVSHAFLIREATKGLDLELDTHRKQLAAATDSVTLKYQAENLLYFSLNRLTACLPEEVKAKVEAVLALHNEMHDKAISLAEKRAEREQTP